VNTGRRQVEVVIRYDARLVQGAASASSPASASRCASRSPTAGAAAVAGFGAASDQLARQVIDWTVSQAAQAQAKNQ
jgi:cholesterol transport system auxiliary component